MAIFNYVPLLIWTLGMFYFGDNLKNKTESEAHAKIAYYGIVFWFIIGGIFTALKI